MKSGSPGLQEVVVRVGSGLAQQMDVEAEAFQVCARTYVSCDTCVTCVWRASAGGGARGQWAGTADRCVEVMQLCVHAHVYAFMRVKYLVQDVVVFGQWACTAEGYVEVMQLCGCRVTHSLDQSLLVLRSIETCVFPLLAVPTLPPKYAHSPGPMNSLLFENTHKST